MMKKVFAISILAVLSAVLVFGAINRTTARSSDSDQTQQGSGSGARRQGGEVRVNQGSSQQGNRTQNGHDQQPLSYDNAQAQVDSWTTISGSVISADNSLVTVELETGESVEIAGRAWSYARENGFSVLTGDLLQMTGFYEDGELKIGSITDLTSGASVQIREQSGRPLWAGRSRNG